MWFPHPYIKGTMIPFASKAYQTIRVIRVDDCVSCYLDSSHEGNEFNSARCEEGLSACELGGTRC